MSLIGAAFETFALHGLWLGWTFAATTLGWILLSTRRESWPDAAAVLSANLGVLVLSQFLFQTRGLTALVFLPHLLFWLPLLLFLVRRSRTAVYLRPSQKIGAWGVVGSLAVLILLDAVAVVRIVNA